MKLKDLIRGNLIGMDAEVSQSSNRFLRGIKGKIVDETKNTLTLRSEKKDQKVPKKDVSFLIEGTEAHGLTLIGRPEERIKTKTKKLTTIQRMVKRNAK